MAMMKNGKKFSGAYGGKTDFSKPMSMMDKKMDKKVMKSSKKVMKSAKKMNKKMM